MFKKFKSISILLALFMVLLISRNGFCWEDIEPEPEAVSLINRFLEALSIEDDDERLNAVIPLVHKSLLNRDGTDLDINVKPWSYKKAYNNVKFYSIPAVITEARIMDSDTVIGWEETLEKGRHDKYFIDKKPGINGMPAPIDIFWPEDGSPPVIYYMGSL